MNDPEPKHSPLCQCENCNADRSEPDERVRAAVANWPCQPGDDMRSLLAFHASVTTQEPHLLISLAREVHGKHYARSTVANGFIGCIQALAPHGTMDDVRAAVAALALAEALLEGKL